MSYPTQRLLQAEQDCDVAPCYVVLNPNIECGWLGVIAVGMLMGIIIRYVDIDVKRALSGSKPSMTRAFASTMLLGVAAAVAISANVSALYVLGTVYLFTWICQKTLALFRSSLGVQEHVSS